MEAASLMNNEKLVLAFDSALIRKMQPSITRKPVAPATGFFFPLFLPLFRAFVILAEERFHRHAENFGNEENLPVGGNAHLPF